MFTEHPSPAELFAIAQGESGHDGARLHVEAGCVSCTAKLRQASGEEIQSLEDLVYDVVFEEDEVVRDAYYDALAPRLRAWKSVGKGETLSAKELEGQLLAIPIATRRDRIRRSHRFASYGLVEHLVERAREEGFREPARAVELANLALEVAEVLEEAGIPERIAADAQALAWAMLANAHRIQTELVEAERAMAAAMRLLASGAGTVWIWGEVLSLEGSLRTTEGRFGDAVKSLEAAAGIFRVLSDVAGEGKVLLQLGNVAGETGDAERAVKILVRSRELLKAAGDRRLELYASQSLANWLRNDGRIEEARAVFDSVEEEFLAEISDPSSRLRFAWLGAVLLAAEGEVEKGEEGLRAVRAAYAEREEVYRFCLVSLELAVLLLEQGRTREVQELTREMVPVFSSRQVHHHALAALVVFQEAVDREQATAALAQSVARYLERAQRNPYLKYEN